MANRRCHDCGRFHAHTGCENGAHEKNRAVSYPTMPTHGHSLHDQQPRVKRQISRKMRTGKP